MLIDDVNPLILEANEMSAREDRCIALASQILWSPFWRARKRDHKMGLISLHNPVAQAMRALAGRNTARRPTVPILSRARRDPDVAAHFHVGRQQPRHVKMGRNVAARLQSRRLWWPRAARAKGSGPQSNVACIALFLESEYTGVF